MPIILGNKISIGRPQSRPQLERGKRYYVKTNEIYNGVNVILSGIYRGDNAHNLIFQELKLEQPVLSSPPRLPSQTEFFDISVDIYTIPAILPVAPATPSVPAMSVITDPAGPNIIQGIVKNNDPKLLEGGYKINRKSRRTRRKQKKQSKVKYLK
jgi:hypothetical protein